MAGSRKKVIENKSSTLLTVEENDLVCQLLGDRCQSISTSVVQLQLTANQHEISKYSGVLCLVKDNPKRSYFIRLFDLDREQMLWEHKLNSRFKLNPSLVDNKIYSFDDNLFQADLYFVDEDEAKMFHDKVEEKLKLSKWSITRKYVEVTREFTQQETFENASTSTSDAVEKKREKTKLTKDDIGNPTEFRHIQHVGWDPERGFDCENIDRDLKPFFDKAGVSDRHLNEKETRKFIYDFIEKNRILEAAKEDASAAQMHDGPPVPKRQLPQCSSPSMSRGTVPQVPPPPPPSANKPLRQQPGEPSSESVVAPQGETVVPPSRPIRPPRKCDSVKSERKPSFTDKATISDESDKNEEVETNPEILQVDDFLEENVEDGVLLDIGLPTEFKHLSHASGDSENGYSVFV